MSNEKRRIYPNCARENYAAILYSDIALRNYARAKEQFEKLDFSSDGFEEDLDFDLLREYSISTIIFSTMCIEAYLNDYAAACLGDKEFYDYFDKLKIEGKFALIGKFVLATEIDKSKSYYYRLRRLVKERNEYTHSKSKKIEGYHCYSEVPEIPIEVLSQWEQDGIDPAPYCEMLDSAKNALLAIRDVALFFDAHDAAADAIARLFGYGEAIPDKNGNDVRNDILRELELKKLVSIS